jgi:hypothetical protein
LPLRPRVCAREREVREALGAVEWTDRDTMGSTHVTITRRAGRTTVIVMKAQSDAAALMGVAGGFGVLLGSVGLGAVIMGTGGLAAPLAALAGTLGATSTSWMLTRLSWRRIARGHTEQVVALGDTLIDAARQALADGRTL